EKLYIIILELLYIFVLTFIAVADTHTLIDNYNITVSDKGTLTVSEQPSGEQGAGSGSSSGGSSSGNYTPGAPSTGGTTITVPVTGSENTVNVTAKVEGSKATVDEIKTEEIRKVTAGTDRAATVEVDLTGLGRKIDSVVLPSKSMEEIAKAAADKTNKMEGLAVKLTTATVELDSTALGAVVEQAKSGDIQLNVDDVGTTRLNEAQKTGVEKLDIHGGIEAYFTCNGQHIGDFKGGEATVKVPFAVPTGYRAAGFSVWYVAEDGGTTKYASIYEGGYLVFAVNHFSDFLIAYDEADASKAADTDGGKETVTMDTAFGTLRLRVDKSTKTTNRLVWAEASGADGYVVYGAQCNTKAKTYKITGLVVIKDGSTTTWTDKALKSGTYYKYYVKAYKLVDGKKVFIAKSKTVHATTTGGKYGNVKSVKVNDTDVTLKEGETFTIQASQVEADKSIQKHAAIKYESTNKKVAAVDSKGVITAKKAGTCYIYVYAQNGVYKKVKVTVKKA
uniref:Ig-like domain-containing protein n=1 Tax=Acetivibrio ethanolgignens TaxID=290052 RepID=UPI000A82D741